MGLSLNSSFGQVKSRCCVGSVTADCLSKPILVIVFYLSRLHKITLLWSFLVRFDLRSVAHRTRSYETDLQAQDRQRYDARTRVFLFHRA